MRNLITLFVYTLIFLTAGTASASPVGISDNASFNLFELESETQFNIQDRGTHGMTIEIDLPESAQILASRGQFSSLLVAMTDNSAQITAVPFISRWVVIPDGFTAEGKVTHNSGRRISVDQSFHSPVYLDQVNVQSAMLINNVDDNNSPVSLGNVVVYRGIRMAPVIVKPFQLSPDSDQMFESSELTFELNYSPDNVYQNIGIRAPYRGEFARSMESLILNPPMRDLAPSTRGKMVIIHSHLLEDDGEVTPLADIGSFADWKRQLGFDVDVLEINTSGENPQDDIKGQLRELYNEGLLDYLIIMGHYDEVEREWMELDENYIFPTNPVHENDDSLEVALVYPGDQNFVTFDGDNDLLPDVIVGRFMCRTYEELSYSLQRSIAYEQNPEAGDWLTRAVYSLDSTSEPYRILQPALDVRIWADRRLREIGYDVIDTVGWFNRFAHAEEIREAISDGTSLALGDGWLWGMTYALFPENEPAEFFTAEVGRMSTFTIANAVHYTIPIMVPFFNQNPEEEPGEDDNGNVGGFGFWDPDDINHDITYILGWSVYGMRYHELFEGGILFQFAGVQIQSNFDVQSMEFEERLSKMSEYQYIGDPTIMIRTNSFSELTVSHPETYNVGATSVSFIVSTGEDQPYIGATVCVQQADNFKFVGITNGNGDISFTIPEGLAEGALQIVVNGHNVVAFVEAVEVTIPDINIVLESFEIIESEDNDDGLFHNGETVMLDLTAANTGAEDADELVATISSNSEFLTFSANEVAIENISAGETGGFAEQIEMMLATNCPGGLEIQVMIKVNSGDLEWLIGSQIISSGPAYKFDGFETLNLDHPRINQIKPNLSNVGDIDSPDLVAILSTDNPFITVRNEGAGNFTAIGVAETNASEANYSFIAEELFIDGQVVNFDLTLTNGNDDPIVVSFSIGTLGDDNVDNPTGPDSYGYLAFDSGDAGEDGWAQTPIYHWREINIDAEIDVAGMDSEDWYPGKRIVYPMDTLMIGDSIRVLRQWDEPILLPLPFELQYYGELFDSCVINANGWMALGSDAIKSRSATPWGIPGIGAPDAQLCPYYLDLFNDENRISFNGVFYHYIEEEGIFVVEWSGVEVREEIDPIFIEFQILLYDAEIHNTATGDGEIVFQYRTGRLLAGPQVLHPFPTIGIRSPDGTDGVQYSFNEGYSAGAREIEDELAIRFTTNRTRPSGSVSGMVVRSDNGITLEGAFVDPHWLIQLETDEDGAFQFDNVPAGSYPFTVKMPNYTTLWDTLEVVAGEMIQLDPIELSYSEPTVDEENRSIHKSLKPDGSMTRADFTLQNQGEGEMEYDVEIRYMDGSASDFSSFEKMDIITLTQGPDIQDSRIRGYAPLYVDSTLYIPVKPRDEVGYITVIDLRDGDQEIVNFPMPLGDRGEPIKSLAWDGTSLWGSIFTVQSKNILFHFDPSGEGGQEGIIVLPAVNSNSNGNGLVYSADRNSMFVVNGEDYENIIEVSLVDSAYGDIINQFYLWFHRRSSEISSLGWNANDIDSMPLYILETYWGEDDPHNYRIMKMNPENGDQKLIAEILEDDDLELRGVLGCSILPQYSSGHIAIALTEQYGSPRSPADTLIIRDLGPNISFFSQGSFLNKSGTILPGEDITIGFEINANGFDQGDYNWSYYVNHNGIGEGLFVPCTLTVDINAEIDDIYLLLPVEFGLQAVYPNPFNNMTRISFGIAKAAMTQLKVYDLTGREVDVLFSGEQTAGNHSIAWNASGLASGVYLLRLETEGMSEARKVVLMK